MQIFIATHDYLLSYELSLLVEYPSDNPIDIKFFSLSKPDRQSAVIFEKGATLVDIEHNSILEEFAAHYDREAANMIRLKESSVRKSNWVGRREVLKNTQVVATQVLCMDGLGRSERRRRQY